jgi:hypothetical protein
MGKRRSNDRQKLQGRIGISKVRYCPAHNELTKAVREWPRKSMMYHCSKGCKLEKGNTVLKAPEGVMKPR